MAPTGIYKTRSAANHNITSPISNGNSGLRAFCSSACCLWNKPDKSLI